MLRAPELTLATWQEPSHLKWSYQHMRELVPTARIARSEHARALVTREGGDELLALAVEADRTHTTVAGVLDSGSTDGFLVLHDGRVALEVYEGMAPDATHLLQSVSKSITGILTGVLVGHRILHPDDEVAVHIPELTGTSFAGATVRHLLDMRAGTRFDETYEDPASDIRESEVQFGWAPRPEGPPAPDAVTYIARLGNHREHGGRFEYRSILTDLLGHVLERAAGAPLNELLGRHLWGPLGAASDAEVTVDPGGFPVADGGISVTLRDLARFAQMVLDRGMVEGREIVPAEWISDTVRGGADSAEAFAADPHADDFPGGHYRNQWWVPHGRSTLVGLGIHGQFVYVDWAARTVGVKLSTWPTPLAHHEHVMTIAAFRAIAHHLASGVPV